MHPVEVLLCWHTLDTGVKSTLRMSVCFVCLVVCTLFFSTSGHENPFQQDDELVR